MSYLTRFDLNPARRGTRDLLASPQRMHAAVLAAFPASTTTPEGTGRVLWRVDQTDHTVALYLTSPWRPDLVHLAEQAGWPNTQREPGAPGWQCGDYTPLLDRLATGQQWNFRLTANPVRNLRRDENAARSQRFGHVTVAQQTQWFLSKAENNGFGVPSGESKEPDVAVYGRRTWKFDRRGHNVTLVTATFQGTLEVTDADALRRAMTNGIGPAKGYGCGLLTLARGR